ncbi:MAG: FAD:protein FMN transferase [Anaerolineales bacterium]
MPITLEIADRAGSPADLAAVWDYFAYVDQTFSTYKDSSEISRLNRRALALAEASPDVRAVYALAEQTRQETGGYFDAQRLDGYDPTGVVKGWAIGNAGALLRQRGFQNFYVEAGGDLQAAGLSPDGGPWQVGIRSPFRPDEIIKVLSIRDAAVATSGTYVRGQHIYNPHGDGGPLTETVSLTVIGPNICDADRFATAAFAMGRAGISFIESLDAFEGYQIDPDGLAVMTSGFDQYVSHA